MAKLIIECKGCGYTWCPDKEKWESNPDSPEPDCPNQDCQYYGTGFHAANQQIWNIKGIVKPY